MMKKQFLSMLCVLALLTLCLGALTACGPTPTDPDAPLYTEDTALGEGDTTFCVRVVTEELTVRFTVSTDQETVGEALEELGLIAGEEGAYGLYVKRVNNILADYDVDGSWWGFYIDGEAALTGVDTTPIDPDADYELRREK